MLFRKADRYCLSVIIGFTVACFFTYWGSYPLRWIVTIINLILTSFDHSDVLIFRKFAYQRVRNSFQSLHLSSRARPNTDGGRITVKVQSG